MRRVLALVTSALLSCAAPIFAQTVTIEPSGSITTNGGVVTVVTGQLARTTGLPGGFGTAGIQVSGTFSGTLQFEGSVDCTTYASLNATPPGSSSAVTSTTATGVWQASIAGLQCVRLRASAFASGTAVVTLRGASGGGSASGGGGGAVSITQGGNTAAVNGSSQLSVVCANCSGSGVSQVDNSGFVPGTTVFVPLGGEVDDTGTTAATENSAGAARITPQRGLHVNLRNNGGTETGTAGTPLRTDPTGSTTQPVSGTVTANAGTGTFTNQQSNVTVDADTGAGTQTLTLYGVALPASGGSVPGGTSTNPIRTDPTGSTTQPISGTVTSNAGTGTFTVAGVAAHDAAASGNPVLMAGVASAAAPAAVSTDGDVVTEWHLRNGSLVANLAAGSTLLTGTGSSLNVNCTGGCSGSTFADNAAFTFGTSVVSPIAGVLDDTGTNAATENSAAIVRITAQKGLHANPRDAAGAQLFGTAAAGADGVSNPTLGGIFSYNNCWNGSTWDRCLSGTLTEATHDGALTMASTKSTINFARASAAAPSGVSADDDAVAVWSLRNGSLVVNLASSGTLLTGTGSSLNVNCTGGCTTTQYTHDAALTPGSTVGTMAMGRASTVAPTAVSVDDAVLPWYTTTGAAVGAQTATVPTTATLQSGATANGNGTVLTVNGLATTVITVNCATCSGGTTINFEGSEDATNFTSLDANQIGTSTIAATTATAGLTYWRIPTAGLQTVRARISAYSAGTVTITGRAVPLADTARVTKISDGVDTAQVTTTAGGSVQVECTSGCGGSGGTSAADGASYVAGTTSGTPLMGARDDSSPGTVAEDKVGIARLTQNRAIHVNLRDASGNELSVSGGTQYAEDTAGADADTVTLAGAERQDTLASNTTTDGDRTYLKVNNVGRMYATATIDAALPAGGNTIGAVTQASGPWSTNQTQVGGNAVAVNTGNADAGTSRVVIATNQPALAGMGVGATGSAPPANASFIGGIGSGATGGLLTGITACDSQAFLDMTTATTTELVALTASRKVFICQMTVMANGTTTFTLKRGTGTNCGTGTTTISPAWDLTAQTGFSQGAGMGVVFDNQNAGDALCVTNGSAVNLHIFVRYAKY